MAKRLTDSEKWKKPWFRKLKPSYKCFWIYILDQCSNAGIWEVDFELAEYNIGTKLDRKEIEEVFYKQFVSFNDKWFIVDFIEFQYKCSVTDLNPNNKAHKSVIDIVKKNNLIELLSNITASKPLDKPLVVAPCDGAKDKDKDKELDKDKDTEKILEYLNESSGKNYKYIEGHLKFIKARLKEGYVFDNFKTVIDKKCAEWKDDPKMNQYLRPETLFGNKFDSYLNQFDKIQTKFVSSNPRWEEILNATMKGQLDSIKLINMHENNFITTAEKEYLINLLEG